MAIGEGANAIGFNFYPRSPRYIAPEQAARIPTPGARRVGVFVNESPELIAEIARIAALDTAQLHGKPSPVIPRTSPSGKRAKSPPPSNFLPTPLRTPRPCCSMGPPANSMAAQAEPSIGPSRAPPASASSSLEASMLPTSPKRSPSRAPGESTPARASKPRPGKRTTPKCKHSFKPRFGRPFKLHPRPSSYDPTARFRRTLRTLRRPLRPRGSHGPGGGTRTGLPRSPRRSDLSSRAGRSPPQLRRTPNASVLC